MATLAKIAAFRASVSSYWFSVILVAALHFFGFLGMWWPPMDELLQQFTPFSSFLSLTPLNLLLNLGLLMAFHRTFSTPFWAAATVIFLAGYFVEVAGVATGQIFGEYAYGTVLGFKLLNVPLLIGVNWLILVYATVNLTARYVNGYWPVGLLAAALMVGLDLMIEPVAIYFDFWQWEGESVPIQNYLAWYLVALPLCLLMAKVPKVAPNPIAPVILLAQSLFFLAHNAMLLLA